MGRTTLHPALQGLRGRIGNLVFRQLYGKTVVSQAPDFSRRKLSARQKAHGRRFAAAVRQARALLANPARKAIYQKKAAKLAKPLMAVAIGDCYRSAKD